MRGLAYRKVSAARPLTRRSEEKMSPRSVSSEQDILIYQTEATSQRRSKRKFRIDGPDGARSWVVAFANFLVNFIIVGLGRMSGILYVDFMNLFHIDRTTASLPFSVQQAARNLFGPLAGILGQKYGVRTVTILGGIIGAISAFTEYWTMDILWITLMWGLVYGISTALTTTINQVSIDQHFEKHRATAGGFAFSGGCVGAFIFPVVLETLISHYGMKGTFLAMGVIIFLVVPVAILLSEPSWRNKKTSSKDRTVSKRKKAKYGSLNSIQGPIEGTNSSIKQKDFNASNGKAVSSEIVKSLPAGSETVAAHTKSAYLDDINFKVLHDNDELVFILLTMDVSEAENRERIPGDLQLLNKNIVISVLEEIHSFLASVQGDTDTPKIMPEFLLEKYRSKRSPPSQNIVDMFTVVTHTENGSSSDSAKAIDIDQHEVNKTYQEISRKAYICSKLKDLYEADEFELLLYFPYEIRNLVSQLFLQLRKLHENFMLAKNAIQLQQSVAPEPPVSNIQEPALEDTQESTEFVNSWRQSRKQPSNSFLDHALTAVKLHGNPLFLLTCLCRGVFMLTFIPIVTVIVDFAIDKGLNKSDGKYFIAVLSLGDFLGRLCLGWINDKGFLSLPRYMLVVMLFLAASTITLPFMNSKASFIAAILIFGILQGSLFVRHPILISKYMKSHEQAIGMGFINLLSGFIGFALPSFIGYFRDTLGSYDKMFYVSGAICAAVGLLWAFEPCFVRCTSKHSYNEINHDTQESKDNSMTS